MANLRATRTVEAPTAVVWDVITDHELYAEAAPNLSNVEVIDGAAETLTRRCVDTNGNTWTESCTRWEPEDGFAVSVNVAESDFHRRLFSRFAGEWSLEQTPDGTEITMAFEFSTRYGPVGRLIAWYFKLKAPEILETIFDRWESAIESQRPF